MTVAPVELSHVWEPNPKQADVLRIISEAPDDSISLIFYGGAASGGKTNLDANLALKIALGCPGSRTLVGRQDFIDLKTTTLQEFDRSLPAGMDVKRYDSAPVYRDLRSCAKNVPESEHPYSRIYFRGLEDWQSLLSEEYGWIIIDEGQQVQLAAALGLMSRLRHKPERKRGMVVTFNPFPSWCVEWGMRGKLPKEIKANPNIRVNFIQARVDDNKHVPEGYRELLAANPDPFLRAILLDGNPDAALDSVLYFSREQLEQSRLYCSEPMEIKLTRPEPDAMADGHVLIWDKPMTSERYYVGADTADGMGEPLSVSGGLGSEFGGPDRNAAAIYRVRDNVQVAAIYGRQQEHHFGRLLDQYGRWYNNALLAVERNRRSVLMVLRELEYPNLYYTESEVDLHTNTRPQKTQERQRQYGWETTSASRPPLLSDFREAMTMRAIHPRDEALIDEGLNFMSGEKPQAGDGFHDDRIFAHAIAWQARKMLRLQQASSGARMWSTPMRM